MENATKALLIAAAVLVAILIISLGLIVYNMASETIDSVNFSGQEVTAFNDKFEQYRGENKRGSEVNAMLKTALNSNLESIAAGLDPNDGAKFVTVNLNGTAVLQPTSAGLGTAKANTALLYTVEIQYDTTTGFANVINATAMTNN